MSLAACTPSSLVSSPRAAASVAFAPVVRSRAWQLAPGQALSLRADRASMLRVRQGRIWVTRDATARQATEDLVLAPGESLAVAAGGRIVMEPWDEQGATYHWDIAANGADAAGNAVGGARSSTPAEFSR